MALDPEKLKKQRQERARQRQAQQRSMMVKLIIAGVALVLVGVLILVLALGRNSEPEDTQPQTNPSGTEATQSQTVITLTVAGDLNITEKAVLAGGGNYDYTNAFLDVAHLLAKGDVTALNLEGNLCGAPYGTDRSAPQSMMQALASAGVDLVQLANSYSIYKGMEGLKSTISGVRQAGMTPLGVYPDAAAAKQGGGYTVCQVQGVKIAFVAFTKGMDGMALPAGNEGCVNVLYEDYSTDYQSVDKEGISKVLDAVAKEEPDLTVALLHWGSEYNDTISKTQETICTLMQEKGVDAIIGTHSHYVQKMVFDPAAGTFIAYSLGDFFGDTTRAGSEYSVILDLEITKDNETGATKITGYDYTPIFTVAEEEKPLRILRIAEAMRAFEEGYLDRVSQETYDAMAYALKRIEARIKG